METKNLTKSFGIRVPLDMYLKMIEVGAENKISITDICLYSLANSGVLKSNFNFKLGGAVNTDHINEIRRLNEELIKSEKNKNTFRKCMEESDEEVKRQKEEIVSLEKQKVERHIKIKSLQSENKRLQDALLEKPKMITKIVTQAERDREIQKEMVDSYRIEMEKREREGRR